MGSQGTSIQIQWQQETLTARRGSRGSDGPAERHREEGRSRGGEKTNREGDRKFEEKEKLSLRTEVVRNIQFFDFFSEDIESD